MQLSAQSLISGVRQTAKHCLLALSLLIWVALLFYSLLLLLLPRRAAGSAAGSELTVVTPFPPGNQSGGAQAVAGLMASLKGHFDPNLIDLSAQQCPRDTRWKVAYALTFAIPVPDHCRQLLFSGGTLGRQLHSSSRVFLEFLGPGFFLAMKRRPKYRVVLRDHEVLLRKLAMELKSAKGLAAFGHALGLGVCFLVGAAIYTRVDRVITLTNEDKACLEQWYPFLRSRIQTLPVHFECTEPNREWTAVPNPREMLFIGNFYHQPNVDGLLWFLKEVAPDLSPGFTLHLCGIDNPLDNVRLSNPYIQVIRHGFVDNIEANFRHVGIALAPIISGGGVRVKNLHLACLGKAIVSTPLGNEGIGFTDGVHAAIAADGKAMAHQLNELARSPHKIRQLGDSASEYVRQSFDRQAIAAELAQAILGR